MTITIMRIKEVIKSSGYARSTIYLRIAQGLWPKPIKIGYRAVGWPSYETEAMNRARIAALSDNEIRQLVIKLEEARKTAFGGVTS